MNIAKLFITVIIIILLIPFVSFAQLKNHLEPEDGPFLNAGDTYLSAVMKTLSRSKPSQTIASVICIPSFSPEWIVCLGRPIPTTVYPEELAKDTLNDFICSEKAVNQIYWRFWKEKEADSLRLNTFETKISSRPIPHFMAEEIKRAFVAVLKNTRYSPPSNYVVLDGTSFHFGVCTSEPLHSVSMFGQTYCPEENSAPSKLLQLGIVMLEYSQANDNISADSLLVKIHHLAKDIMK